MNFKENTMRHETFYTTVHAVRFAFITWHEVTITKPLFINFGLCIYLFYITDPGDHRWVGMWWGGFLLCGLLLILVAIPFFSFPKVLVREKEKIRLVEKAAAASGSGTAKAPKPQTEIKDTGYGKDIKGKSANNWDQ